MPKMPAKKSSVGKHPGGRPTKYRPELCQDLIKFFDRPLYIKKKTRKWLNGEEVICEEEVPNKTPFFIHWCMKHKLSWQTPHNWLKEYPEFLDAYNRSKILLEAFLVELGIKGDHNGFMTFQTLKNVSGWRDKTEVETKTEHKLTAQIIVKYEEMTNDQLTEMILGRLHERQSKLN
jgi:hypothetical protein